MSTREMISQLFAEPGPDEPRTIAGLLPRALLLAWRWKVQLLVALLAAALVQARWDAPGWLIEQIRVLPNVLVAPITTEQYGDVNFWGGQLISIGIVTLSTYAVVNNRGLWEKYVVDYLFYSAWQKAIFRHLMLSAVKDELAFFMSRQLTMLFAGFFIPAVVHAPAQAMGATGLHAAGAFADPSRAAAEAGDEGWWDWEAWRHSVDKRLALGWYVLTAMLWYGVRMGLFKPPERLAQAATWGAYGLHFVGVATLRIYPVFSAAGVDLVSGLRTLLFVYPLTALGLGAAAVLPSMHVGRRIKARLDGTFSRIFMLYVANVVSVMWTTRAGRSLGAAMLASPAVESLQPLTSLLTVSGRVMVLVALVAVGAVYLHAVHVLYLGSPLFLCEWGMPTVRKVVCEESPEVVRHLKRGYDQYFGARRTHSSSPGGGGGGGGGGAAATAAVATTATGRGGGEGVPPPRWVATVGGTGSGGSEAKAGGGGGVGSTPPLPTPSAPPASPVATKGDKDGKGGKEGANGGGGTGGAAEADAGAEAVPPSGGSSADGGGGDGDAAPASPTAPAAPTGRAHDIVGFIRHALGLTIGLRRLWQGRGRLHLRVELGIHATNVADRDFHMQQVRLEVTTQHSNGNGGFAGDDSDRVRKLRLLEVRIGAFMVPARADNRLVVVQVDMVMAFEALLQLARVSLGGDPLQRLDVVLYNGTALSSLEFSLPLLSFAGGEWRGLFDRVSLDPAPLWERRHKLEPLRAAVVSRQRELLKGAFAAAHEQLQRDLRGLDEVLQRLSSATLDEEEGPDEAAIEDLVEAAYYVVSVYHIECEEGIAHTALAAALLHASSLLMNLFYQWTCSRLMVGRDPVHLLVLSASMVVLQGLMFSEHGEHLLASLREGEVGADAERVGDAEPERSSEGARVVRGGPGGAVATPVDAGANPGDDGGAGGAQQAAPAASSS